MASAPPRAAPSAAPELLRLSLGVFFVGGFLTSVVNLLVPRLRLALGLGYAEATMVQLAFYSSYLLFALPVTLCVIAIGYMRAIALGLATMAVACLGLMVALGMPGFGLILAALLLLSAGVTFLQIASNTVITLIGPSADEAAPRLTLLQGFNSLGTVLGPLLCSSLLLGAGLGSSRPAFRGWAALPFLGSAAVLAALALLFVGRRDLIVKTEGVAKPTAAGVSALLADRRLRAGAAAIFLYVGAEVTIAALLTDYLLLADGGFSPAAAGRMVSLYWGGAMVGRFAGAFLMRLASPADLLSAAAVGAVALAVVAISSPGLAGATALILVGLCNSIMYPTIYVLALPRSAAAAPLGSMALCMAVVGGAVVPVLTGLAADRVGLASGMMIPALCYLGIGAFGLSCRGSANSARAARR